MVNMYRARGRGYQMATKNSGDCRYLGNQNVEKLNFLNPIYTRIWSHLTLSTPCALCRVPTQGKQDTMDYRGAEVAELSYLPRSYAMNPRICNERMTCG
jgi:hypothetical protein